LWVSRCGTHRFHTANTVRGNEVKPAILRVGTLTTAGAGVPYGQRWQRDSRAACADGIGTRR
jgi:hypothetical protein